MGFEEGYLSLKESLGVGERIEEEIDQEQDISTESTDNVGDPELTFVPCIYDVFFSFTGVHYVNYDGHLKGWFRILVLSD